jgi:hypothetical protein
MPSELKVLTISYLTDYRHKPKTAKQISAASATRCFALLPSCGNVPFGMAKPGPKTPKAKAAVRHNAVQHGIRSDVAVIDGMEDPEEWQWHRDGIIESFQPEGVLEFTLAERVALILWKLKRVEFYQSLQTRLFIDKTESDMQVAEAYANRTLAEGVYPQIDPEEVRRHELLRALPPDDVLDRTIRYEAHLHRQYVQTMHELEALQTRRTGGQSPLARLDISAPPSA